MSLRATMMNGFARRAGPATTIRSFQSCRVVAAGKESALRMFLF